jgi:cyclopropane fatty-acyl-phospholipid synthase-like methyltransferase
VATTCLERWQDLVAEAGAHPGNRLHHARQVFGDVELAGKRLLDIGCGSGWESFYASCLGATVVGLEPEAAGSASGSRAEFERGVAKLGLNDIRIVPSTLQAYDGTDLFDVVLSVSSINHLDEDACTRLHVDEAARAEYRSLLGKLAHLTSPGGTFIAIDCGRKNLFASLGLRNPILRSIEWGKHQQPELWAELLTECGFQEPSIRWLTFNSLRGAGRLLENRVAAYCSTSIFRLEMTRSS